MSNNSLIFKNTIFLITRTIVTSFVGLFTVRELLRILGTESYGLFSLVFGIALLFSFINSAMVSSTQRYLSYHIGTKDIGLLKKVWKSSVFLHLIIAVFVCLLLFLFKNIFIFKILNISKGMISSAVFIYYGSIATIFITIMQSPFNALVLSNEKMSFYAWTSLASSVLKLTVVYILYILTSSKLETYTLLYFSSSFIIFAIYVLYCKYNFRYIFAKTKLDPNLTKEIFFYSSWNLYGSFAAVSKSQGTNIILNISFGVLINAAYAVTNTVSSVISTLINSVTAAINPQIYKSYAQKDNERNFDLITYGSKYSYLFAVLLISPLYLSTEVIMELWLESVPDYSVEFIKLTLVATVINCLSGPLMTGVQATGKIKAYQIIVGFVVFANLPISYALLYLFEEPTIPFLVSIVIAIVSMYLRLLFLNRLTGYRIERFLKDALLPAILVTLCFSVFYFIINSVNYSDNLFITFIIKSFIVTVINMIAIYLIGLNKKERPFLISKFSKLTKIR